MWYKKLKNYLDRCKWWKFDKNTFNKITKKAKKIDCLLIALIKKC